MSLAWLPLVLTLSLPGSPDRVVTIDRDGVNNMVDHGAKIEANILQTNPWWLEDLRPLHNAADVQVINELFATPRAKGQGNMLFVAVKNGIMTVLRGNPFADETIFHDVQDLLPNMQVMLVTRDGRVALFDDPVNLAHIHVTPGVRALVGMDNGNLVVKCTHDYIPQGLVGKVMQFPHMIHADATDRVNMLQGIAEGIDLTGDLGGGASCRLVSKIKTDTTNVAKPVVPVQKK